MYRKDLEGAAAQKPEHAPNYLEVGIGARPCKGGPREVQKGHIEQIGFMDVGLPLVQAQANLEQRCWIRSTTLSVTFGWHRRG